MSENLAPEEVVDILNEYFGVITDAIFKNKGTLDKFIGDAAMAVFNSPFDLDDYVYRAVMTACDIAKASEALGEKKGISLAQVSSVMAHTSGLNTWKVWYQGNREIKREILFKTTYRAYQETIEYNPK